MKKISLEVTKQEALARFLKVDPSEVGESGSDDDSFQYKWDEEYLVLTDDEADGRAKSYILDSAWAFTKSFLDAHSDIIAEMDGKTWEAITSRCESSNAAVLAMIPDKDHFVDDAILADGRGHFLASYDSEENEQDGFYIYRIN